MSLKDAVRWVEPNFVIDTKGKQRYQPIRQKDMVAFIPVAALLKRMQELHDRYESTTAQKKLLAELEGL